jgi:hypothetical protein
MLKPNLNLSCRIANFISSRSLDDGKELPAWLHTHFGRCPGCRERYEAERALTRQLSTSAATWRPQAPPFLATRILANLESSSPRSEFLRRHFAYAGALAAVAALFFVINFDRSSTTPPSSSSPILAKASPDLPVISTREDLLALSSKLDEPLEVELRLAIIDARTALTSLSHNLIPEDLLADRTAH